SRNKFSSRAKPRSAIQPYSPVVASLRKKIGYSRRISANSVGNVGTEPTASPRSLPWRVTTRRFLCSTLFSSTCRAIGSSIHSQKKKAADVISGLPLSTLYAFRSELVTGTKRVASTLVFQAPQLLARTTVPAHVLT